MALKMLGLAKEDVIGYMLGLLNLENEFSLDEIQENNDSFLLDINEEEGIIARVNFSTIVQETGFVTGYIAVLHDVTEQQQVERERREFSKRFTRTTYATHINEQLYRSTRRRRLAR